MPINDFGRLHEFVEAYGNPYLAVKHIGQMARRVAEKYDNRILHSEAISWIVNGEKPDMIDDHGKLPPKHNYIQSYIDEILSYVDDDNVCEAVRSSYIDSETHRHLIYNYNDISDTYRQARVRVLTRMIWYRFHLYTQEEDYHNE